MQDHWARGSIIYLYVGLVAQAEDWESFEEEKPLTEETVLMNREVDFGHNGLRMNASSAKGGQGQEE